MHRLFTKALGGLTLAAVLAGCTATGGSSQFQNTVYDIHRRVVKLDNDMQGSITRLNETSAELSARVGESDQETRRLRTIAEENQARLDSIQRQLNDLINRLYRDSGMTTAPGGAAPRDTVTIEPPAPGPRSEAQPAAPQRTEPREDLASAPAAQVIDVPGVSAPSPQVETAPPAAGGMSEDAETAYRRAQRSYANEDYATARAQFDEFLQRYPGSDQAANAQFWKAKCYMNLQQYRESITEFERLRANHANHSKAPFAMHNQAVAHSRLGQTQEAIRLLEAVIANYPTTAAAEQARSDVQRLRGE